MRKWVKILLIILVVLVLLYSADSYLKQQDKKGREWKQENCDLTFHKYTYLGDCSDACLIKCRDEGFPHLSSSYFEPYLSGEEMMDITLYKRCECNCGGCRE